MDQQYGPTHYNPAEWDDVDRKLDKLGNMTVGELLGWTVAGVILVAGVWQAAHPITRVPPERGSAV